MIYSPNPENRIHQHIHDIEIKNRIRIGQRKMDALEQLERAPAEKQQRSILGRIWDRIVIRKPDR
jgi:hypothetical protein